MQHFIGTYECKADIKGRIMLPSALKKQLSSKLDKGFVLKRAVFNHCLELYPLVEWEGLMNRINKLNRFNKKNIDFIRAYLLEHCTKNLGKDFQKDTYFKTKN